MEKPSKRTEAEMKTIRQVLTEKLKEAEDLQAKVNKLAKEVEALQIASKLLLNEQPDEAVVQ